MRFVPPQALSGTDITGGGDTDTKVRRYSFTGVRYKAKGVCGTGPRDAWDKSDTSTVPVRTWFTEPFPLEVCNRGRRTRV